jgi:RHH-type proline utilization regulon transcriptional repressor/proline dehydrogenase/delta 1-pyrroline-5-carboxylate dehydrogenase
MIPTLSPWDSLDDGKYRDEGEAIAALLVSPSLSSSQRADAVAEGIALVEAARKAAKKQGVVESFLAEFSLGTREGLALMCLAEALLRTPDPETRDRLIAEKIGSADWASHLGQSDSLFVNASTWGLMLTGKLIDVGEEPRSDPKGWLARLTQRVGEPVIRQAVGAAVRIMGEQFVLGRTIEAALARAKKEGYLCSFDMLGEGARTAADAERYEHIYAAAIEAVGKAGKGGGSELGHGISVKLSALSPRYEAVQDARVWIELYPRVLRLAQIAARYDLNFAIDAEEADRLVLSLQLFERLARAPELAGWTGLGIVVQAYQKRGRDVIDRLAALAKATDRRIMVRLVKGAYWDSEVKKAQVAGRPDYPVFTTKPATDLSYLVCARALIDAAPHLYPQFATHNAHTLAAVRRMAADSGVTIEHQRLHGMGEGLYRAAEKRYGPLRLRAYAPVGGHEDLLPYLVRRLLENGANTSFVHALLDEAVPADRVVTDPIATVTLQPGRHPRIPVPADIYGPSRRNPPGRDYSIAQSRIVADRDRLLMAGEHLLSGPILNGALVQSGAGDPVTSPTDGRRIGTVYASDAALADRAIAAARAAQPHWDAIGGPARAQILRAMGVALEGETDALVALLSLEAGKTLNDGVSEVREAVDFCRYYADLAEKQFAGFTTLNGPVGETNQLELRGRGVFACISPWNFPLAIFTGQIAAALAAGNAVIAKPAEQTPLVAGAAVRLFHRAGLAPDLLALLPGEGSAIGPVLTAHPGIAGVAFTGGTETAWAINRSLAARNGPIVPLIAETGGLNGMFVDTTALKEQVVDDVILSAFGSAGQRCSALRILFLPAESADLLVETLKGALDALVIGDPADPATDVGPVIDAEARDALDAHRGRLSREAKILHVKDMGGVASGQGSFFPPIIAEIPTPDFLEREVFGPILHIYRYRRGELPRVAKALADRGYGLTLGIHSRVEGFAQQVRALVPAGNCYVNRSVIGAVVGVQPFGGEGLSGTGPKAGGPHALLRYAVERALSVNITAQGGDPALLNL